MKTLFNIVQKYIFVVIFFFLSIYTQAQTFRDSLSNKSYNELKKDFYSYVQKDTLKARSIADVFLKRAKIDQDTFKIADAYHFTFYLSQYRDQQLYLDSIIKLTTQKQSKTFPAQAYFDKAQLFLYKKRNIQNTINNLNQARKYAKQYDNVNLLYRIDYHIAIIKSEHLNEKEDALSIFKKCANFYNSRHAYLYLNTLHAIAETYIGLKKHDSASYYNKLGYTKAVKNSDLFPDEKYYFTLSEGINRYEKKEYQLAIDSIRKALPIIKYNDQSNTIDSYFYLGKSYYKLGQKEKAIPYFIKTDSILETLHSIPQYKHVKTYEYLKEYYRGKKDLQNQNKYLQKLNTILDKYLNDRVHISKKVKEDYDVPLLLEEQQVIIKKLNKNTNAYQSSIILLIALLLAFGSLLYVQFRKKKLYRSRFEALMRESNSTRTIVKVNNTNQDLSKKELKVPEKHATYILNKLEEFERDHKYLTIGTSIQSLADDMETNIKYLSQVINYYKSKSFTSYLNELRITYAVEELKNNKTLRKFTIKAIAQEMGYKNAETFSNAFYKYVKIKPSYFIKNIEKRK
ncbi:helix-turn-helix domain-containing protein [Aquimarina sp. AU474]|uniref:helix-turn-helix domain-containing protein n=1 Tax=Aquimarina sp. AU474 TaxID=2108529 RepID=UPI00135CDF0B|nr:helix-turn-helix domain-containing protein [Aquimarina sp. AU474]